jgi:hypothetical protein
VYLNVQMAKVTPYINKFKPTRLPCF